MTRTTLSNLADSHAVLEKGSTKKNFIHGHGKLIVDTFFIVPGETSLQPQTEHQKNGNRSAQQQWGTLKLWRSALGSSHCRSPRIWTSPPGPRSMTVWMSSLSCRGLHRQKGWGLTWQATEPAGLTRTKPMQDGEARI